MCIVIRCLLYVIKEVEEEKMEKIKKIFPVAKLVKPGKVINFLLVSMGVLVVTLLVKFGLFMDMKGDTVLGKVLAVAKSLFSVYGLLTMCVVWAAYMKKAEGTKIVGRLFKSIIGIGVGIALIVPMATLPTYQLSEELKRPLKPTANKHKVEMAEFKEEVIQEEIKEENHTETEGNLNVEVSERDFEYTYDEELGGIVITNYLGGESNVRIPSNIEGKPVVALMLEDDYETLLSIVKLDLGEAQYKKLTIDLIALESVIIPEGTTEIWEMAFNGCGALKEVVVPSSVIKINTGAFAYCGMEKLSFSGENNIEEIGMGAFACSGIKELPFSDKLRVIRENAFESCYKLEIVNIPEGTITIEKCAFTLCEELKEVSIADTVTEMGERIFDCCKKLETVKLSKGIGYIPAYCFLMCGVKEIYIPGNIKVIENWAFDQCGIEKVTMEEGVVEIKERALCQNYLQEVYLPNSIEKVANDAFGDCQVFHYAGNTYGRDDMLALFR